MIPESARAAFRTLFAEVEAMRCALAGLGNPLDSIDDHERYRAVWWDLETDQRR